VGVLFHSTVVFYSYTKENNMPKRPDTRPTTLPVTLHLSQLKFLWGQILKDFESYEEDQLVDAVECLHQLGYHGTMTFMSVEYDALHKSYTDYIHSINGVQS